MEQSDEAIVNRIVQGDTQAYEILICRYQDQIYNLMYRCTHSPENAAELTQDVFCKTFEKLSHLQIDRSFFSWFYTLALNHARDWLRKEKRQPHRNAFLIDQDPVQGGIDSPAEQVEKQELLDHITLAMMTLPLKNQEMLILRYHYGHSIAELSEIFNLSVSAVKMRLHRSLATLQQKLEGQNIG